MTVRERRDLLQTSVAEDPDNPRSRRFNVRRGIHGIEVFAAQATQEIGSDVEFHGYPQASAPPKVLRVFRDDGRITDAEYRRLVKLRG
jgi:hypothetical protein